MLKLKLSPQSILDLEVIYQFTFKSWGIKQAEKYQDELFNGMISISKNPSLGSEYYFKKGNYRKTIINRHLIFYTISEKECIVMRILHERMDLESHLWIN